MTGEVMVEMLTIKPSKGQSTSVYPHSMQCACKDSGQLSPPNADQSADYVCGRERGTDSGVQKGLPAVRIVSKAVTDDIISGQTVDSSYQQGEDVLTGLTDVSLEKIKRTSTQI